jgi:hypothetical protein
VLAPSADRFIAPWKRGDQPGNRHGGNKYDLSEWNEEYFARLDDLVAQAGKRGIVLEMVLFSYLYYDDLWLVNPMNAANHVGGVEEVPRAKVYTLENGQLLGEQERFVRKIVEHLRNADNVYFELINEPYSISDGTDYDQWQQHMAQVIRDCEPTASKRHLIARNFNNDSQLLFDLDRNISILNFHYASPCAVYGNYHLRKVVSFDETGFSGKDMAIYRHQAWEFMLSGGSVFSHLDYSFTIAHPDGTHVVDESTPGAGSHYLRKQFKILKDFLESVPFWEMTPSKHLQPGFRHRHLAHIMACEGSAYIGYLNTPLEGRGLQLFLREGTYRAEWINPADGATLTVDLFHHESGARTMSPPPYDDDIALRVTRVSGESGRTEG